MPAMLGFRRTRWPRSPLPRLGARAERVAARSAATRQPAGAGGPVRRAVRSRVSADRLLGVLAIPAATIHWAATGPQAKDNTQRQPTDHSRTGQRRAADRRPGRGGPRHHPITAALTKCRRRAGDPVTTQTASSLNQADPNPTGATGHHALRDTSARPRGDRRQTARTSWSAGPTAVHIEVSASCPAPADVPGVVVGLGVHLLTFAFRTSWCG